MKKRKVDGLGQYTYLYGLHPISHIVSNFLPMRVIEVNTASLKKEWHRFQRRLYRNDGNFSAPIERFIEDIFTPGRNEFFSNGCATRFLLQDGSGRIIGRCAAFVNGNRARAFAQPTGGMGFFECIDSQPAADCLFDACKQWLSRQGMEAMDGPVNFGENDNYWGLLVEGFVPSAYGMNYNPPYYKRLFENYGFKPYFEQVSNLLDFTKPFPERFWKIARWVRSRNEYHCRHFEPGKADAYIRHLKEIYDDAWQYHENFTPLKENTIRKELEEGKGLIDPELIWFAYRKDEPVAFLVMFPDASPILKRFHGKLNFFNKIRFLILKQRHAMHSTRITIMGVKIRYQRSGMESLLFSYAAEALKRKPWYTHVELSWVGDFNPKMRALHESVGACFHQKHLTYRYLFDQDECFSRSAIIAKDTKERHLHRESDVPDAPDREEPVAAGTGSRETRNPKT